METIKTDSGVTVVGANAVAADLIRPSLNAGMGAVPVGGAEGTPTPAPTIQPTTPRHVARAYIPGGGDYRILLEVNGKVESVLLTSEGERVAEGEASRVQVNIYALPAVPVARIPPDSATVAARKEAAERKRLTDLGGGG